MYIYIYIHTYIYIYICICHYANFCACPTGKGGRGSAPQHFGASEGGSSFWVVDPASPMDKPQQIGGSYFVDNPVSLKC